MLATAPFAFAQSRPYIGFAYPAGGQQGTTFQIRVGGQGLDDVNAVLVTGSGVTARLVEYYGRLNNQEMQLMREQLKELKRAKAAGTSATAPPMTSETSTMMSATADEKSSAVAEREGASSQLTARIEKRIQEYVQTPASAAIASLAMVEVTIAPDAELGRREIRLVTLRGVSNPLAFHVGQVPEISRNPMITAPLQVLGKEAAALRKRPAQEVEDRITLPCTVNGQIASREVNRYRFEAHKGQRLVITTLGRQLVPYLADAVPGWFQPVLVLYDANGKEAAYDDDYRFNPDPTIFYEVPKDGEYVFEIHDSLYRGREDFVYRITVGELPFITSLFPLGAGMDASPRRHGAEPDQPAADARAARPYQHSTPPKPAMRGWNLEGAELNSLPADSPRGIHSLTATRKGLVSNRVPFALDDLPECSEKEPNNDEAHAQKVKLPTIINGSIDKPDDWDVFQFAGKSNNAIVAEVSARRLNSPLDSVIKLTDAKGTVLAFNDDYEDLCSGLNTHQADSYFMAKLPADGIYYVYIGDTARQGGEEYAYRLRISAPQPDFELRVVPSSVSLRGKATATVSVYASRKDAFSGPIKLALKNPPAGFSASPVTLMGTQAVARLTFKSSLANTEEPVNLSIVGSATIEETEVAHEAVPAEDRMQAFLWRHLVPASDLKVLVYNPSYKPPPKRVPRARPPAATEAKENAGTNTVAATNATVAAAATKPKFSKQQIAGRLRELKHLFEDGLLTEDFYDAKVAECDAAR